MICLAAFGQRGQTKVINQRVFGQQWGLEKRVGLNNYDLQFQKYGIDTVSAEWFELCLHSGSLAEYLEKQSEYVDFYGQTDGTWANGDLMLFSVQGNSYRMNRFYRDGFRIDSRFMPGVSAYKANMMYHNLVFDVHQSKINMESIINDDADFVSGLFDMSGLFGGPDISTYAGSSGYGFYPKDRSYSLASGELEFQLNVEDRKTVRYYRTFRHHAYADVGYRRMVSQNGNNQTGYVDKLNFHVEADGEISMPSRMRKIERRDMVRMYYLVSASRMPAGQQLGFNLNELYTQDYYTASVYFRSPEWNQDKYRLFGLRRPSWTMGVTYGLGRTSGIKNFSRNMIDLDGLGFEPWTPKGMNHELSYACTVNHDINNWLRVHYDGFNSLIFYHATDRMAEHSNELLWYGEELESADRYMVVWDSKFMYGALLENTVGLEAHYQYKKKYGFRFVADATIDGFIMLNKKSVVRPNWQAEFSFFVRPNSYFELGMTVGNYRIPFSLDDMRFFADGWNSGVIYKSGNLFGTTGGKYHKMNGWLQQPQYVLVDLPIKVAIGRHEISFNTTYKKFYNLWTVNYAEDPIEYGYYSRGIYFETAAEKQYVVDYRPTQGSNFLTNSPFYFSNVLKYSYNGSLFVFSASWQTTVFNAVSDGNDLQSMDLMTLSERTANPNSRKVVGNNSPYVTTRQMMPLGTARVMFGFNTKHWRAGLTFKYINGRPWNNYQLAYHLDEERVTYYTANVGGGNWSNLYGLKNIVDGGYNSIWTDPVFDLDFNLMYRDMAVWDNLYEIQLTAYNLVDFASRLNGNAFNTENFNYLLTRPRGITLKVKFEI